MLSKPVKIYVESLGNDHPVRISHGRSVVEQWPGRATIAHLDGHSGRWFVGEMINGVWFVGDPCTSPSPRETLRQTMTRRHRDVSGPAPVTIEDTRAQRHG